MSFEVNKYSLPNPTGTISNNNKNNRRAWISSHVPSSMRRRKRTDPLDMAPTQKSSQWGNIKLFRGMINDIKRRGPYYLSDWTDAWDYRVVPATIYMYFAKYDATTDRPPSSNHMQYPTSSCILIRYVYKDGF